MKGVARKRNVFNSLYYVRNIVSADCSSVGVAKLGRFAAPQNEVVERAI